MILLIDNYDSFVYNLARYFEECGQEVRVVRNDELSPDAILREPPGALVISPGPCTPEQAGYSVEIVSRCSGRFPILGVCLGHQAIAQAFGGRVICTRHPMHGVASGVFHRAEGIFEGLPSPLEAGRYHSLVVAPDSLPRELVATAHCFDGDRETIMALSHREHLTLGLQFHPESILTPHGHRLIENFLDLAGLSKTSRLEGIGTEPLGRGAS